MRDEGKLVDTCRATLHTYPVSRIPSHAPPRPRPFKNLGKYVKPFIEHFYHIRAPKMLETSLEKVNCSKLCPQLCMQVTLSTTNFSSGGLNIFDLVGT